MSKIFDAAAKHGVIDLGDLAPPELEGPSPRATPESETARRSKVASGQTLFAKTRSIRLRASASSPVFPFGVQQQHAAEQYRVIRTKILHDSKKPRVILVSSATSGDGKTVTAINIAASMALKNDCRTLLIDADLRFPSIAQELELPVSPGLSDLLSGSVDLDATLIRLVLVPSIMQLMGDWNWWVPSFLSGFASRGASFAEGEAAPATVEPERVESAA